jgi:hypothetical protein
MKKTLLILLILLLPLQSIAAAQRNLTHLLGSGSGQQLQFVIKHIGEHADHILHHHDEDGDHDADDGNTHVDTSQSSMQHLADFEQGSSMNILLPTLTDPGLLAVARIAPTFDPDGFSEHTPIPLLRPPRPLV